MSESQLALKHPESTFADTSVSASRAQQASARPAPQPQGGSYIGPEMSINGEMSFTGTLRVDGRIGGRINSEEGKIVIGRSGEVRADVSVAVALVEGTVVGNIIASESINFGNSARVEGNIQTTSVSIEEGAVFEGNCRMLPASASSSDRHSPIDLDLPPRHEINALLANRASR